MADQMVGGGQQNAIGSREFPKAKGQGIMEESSTQKASMGEKLEFSDGRVFRYAKASAAISSGLVVSTDDVYKVDADTNDTFVAQAAGSTTFKLSARSGDSLDEYAGAYFGNITNGEQYRIKSNTASATVDGVANTVIFTLYDPLKTAIAATDDYLITPNPYASVITATVSGGTTDYDRAVGVTPIAISSGYYFWLQTKGIAFVKADAAAAITKGTPVTLSDSTAGTVQDQDALAENVIGICVTAAATGTHGGVQLTLE
tara:strand:+ start:3071 stop:3847 length:777 start_codon:yes stop_codon:yes gene_type:complete